MNPMFIGEHTQFPFVKHRSILIKPGSEHFLDMSGEVISADEIKKISPENRNCFFPAEGNLEFYSKYSFQNCFMECSIKLVEQSISCIPWYLPQSNNSKVCDPWTEMIFMEDLSMVEPGNCSNCLPDCESSRINVDHSSANFR